MNDNAIKNYAVWARRELIADVQKRCMRYGISETGSAPADTDSIEGRVLTALERQQRKTLLAMAKNIGYRELVERAAYTWFNRLLAIRFMEVNDRLPSHVRVLSAGDGSFKPQALAEAMDLPLDALDPTEVANLIQCGDDEALFRTIFLAQCDELASCMPDVFDKVGSAMELLLPDGLLREDGVVERLVTSILEDDWREGVEIVGWMYQYYVSERKDEVFASFKKGKKAERESIAPATQLFTPNWIVRYLTENSLGRLWMLNRPESRLVDDMPYFVKPDEDAETEFKRVASPEEITVVDPACGSGHILVYAFELLSKMYVEAGYTSRDAARLILEKNLSGMEIDPRAGAMASFALTMKACELDSRFLRRGVTPRITVLSRVEFDSEELRYIENLRNRPELMDAVAHLDECGSLLNVTSEDLEAIARDLATLAGEESIFDGLAARKLEQLQAELEPLNRRYDVVVANPPYMGSSSLGRWMGSWVKNRYPEAYRDLCTSFIDRGFSLGGSDGYSAMVTMQSWMFLGSFEKLRGKILRNHSISSMAHLGTRAFGAIAGEVVSTTATVFANTKTEVKGAYFRLVDMGSEAKKQAGLLEALANPDCGWFFKLRSKDFEVIPGSPIAYWVSSNSLAHFRKNETLAEHGRFLNGMSTGKNEAVVRLWSEVSVSKISFDSEKHQDFEESKAKYAPYNKGGEFRKWFGNQSDVLAYDRESNEYMDSLVGHRHNNPDTYFRRCLSWSKISSGKLAMRLFPSGFVYDVAGCSLFLNDQSEERYILALFNSSVEMRYLEFLAPTLNFEAGQIKKTPFIHGKSRERDIADLVSDNVNLSKSDWDAFEESWNFLRHPLI